MLFYYFRNFAFIKIDSVEKEAFELATQPLLNTEHGNNINVHNSVRKSYNKDLTEQSRFCAGYAACAREITRLFSATHAHWTKPTLHWTNWLAKHALKPRSEPIVSRNALWSPDLNQLTRERALKPRTEPMTRETRSEAFNWLAKHALMPRIDPFDSRNALWSPQLTRETRSDAQTEPIDSRNALWSPELNQLTREMALWSPELNQLTRETRSEPFNWLAKHALMPRTEPIDSRNALWRLQLTRKTRSEARAEQLTRETRSEAPNDSRNALWCPNWTNWLAKRALKPRTEPIDSRNALWSPELNQLTRETRSEARTEPIDSRNAFEAPNWTNWLAKRALKPRTEPIDSRNALKARTEPIDSRNALWSPELTNWLAKRALKPRTEPIDSRNALWSPQLTRENHSDASNWTNWLANALWSPRTGPNDLRSEVPNWTKWFVLCARIPELNQMKSRYALKSRTEQLYTKAARSTLINAVLSGIIGKMNEMPMTISEDSWFPSEIHKPALRFDFKTCSVHIY